VIISKKTINVYCENHTKLNYTLWARCRDAECHKTW